MARTPVFVLTVACLMLALNMGVRGGFGLFLRPISHEYGWPLEVFSLSMAIQALVWGLSQPIAGALADRFGTLRVVILSGLAYAGGVLMMAMASTPMLMYLASFVVGVAISGTSFGVVFGPVARSMPVEKRSTALGIATAGASAGLFVGPILTERFIAYFGWMGALYALAVLVALTVPLAPLLAGGKAAPASGPAPAPQSLRAALAEASAHPGFWYLTAGFFVCGFHVTFIATCGLPAAVGGWALALVGLFNVVGSYGAGVMGGLWRKKYLLAWIYAGRAVVIALFMALPKNEIVVLGFAAAMGLLWLSTVPLTSGLVAQIFGPQYMATLFGMVFVGHQVGSFLGGWLGGVAFDKTGSYDVMWIISILLGLGAAVLHMPIGDRPVPRLAPAKA